MAPKPTLAPCKGRTLSTSDRSTAGQAKATPSPALSGRRASKSSAGSEGLGVNGKQDDAPFSPTTPKGEAGTARVSIFENPRQRRGSESGSVGSGGSVFFATQVRDVSKPFMCKLAYRCMVDDPVVGGMRYVPFNVDVSLAFIDISGYSKLTAALKSKGAHALAAAVNGYFERMITCVSAHHGTVLKFAGDALMVAFVADDVAVSAQRSVQCCQVLQKEHGDHTVAEANNTTLRIHIGVAAGMLTNLVLQPHTRAAKVMPAAFHYVGGEVLRDVADVVDGSAAGEVCVTPAVAERCGAQNIVTAEREPKVLLLKSFTMPEADRDAADFMETSDGDFESDDEMSKSTSLAPSQSMYGTGGGGVTTVEDLFMPPAILGKLKGGLRSKDIAEMRSLVVLFIKKTGIASVAEWFEELHEVLAANRCPVTQIIDDDKGVHVVAAVNLYVVEEGACDSVFTIAREITARRLGCTVGIASGPCFCGIVGGEEACRWDVTGFACVRACRLMQFAEKEGISVAVDMSVVSEIQDKSAARMYNPEVPLKGTADPVPVFTLAEKTSQMISAMCAINEFVPTMYQEEHALVRGMFTSAAACKQGTSIVVEGPTGSGKKTLILRALHGMSIVPLMHRTARVTTRLHVVTTIGRWFVASPDASVRAIAEGLVDAYSHGHVVDAQSRCVELFVEVAKLGTNVALVVDRAQYLDDASLGLIAHILEHRKALVTEHNSLGSFTVAFSLTPLFGCQSSSKLTSALPETQQIAVRGCAATDIAEMHRYFSMYPLDMNTSNALHELSGGLPGNFHAVLPYFARFAVGSMYAYFHGEIDESELKCSPDNTTMTTWSPAFVEDMNSAPHTEVCPQLLQRLGQFYDVLNAKQQTLLKVLAVMCWAGTSCPRQLAAEAAAKFLSRVTPHIMLHEMDTLEELLLIQSAIPTPEKGARESPRIAASPASPKGGAGVRTAEALDKRNRGRVKFYSGSLLQVVHGTLTPVQLATVAKRGISLLHTEPFSSENDPTWYTTLGKLHHVVGDADEAKSHMQAAWRVICDRKEQGAMSPHMVRVLKSLNLPMSTVVTPKHPDEPGTAAGLEVVKERLLSPVLDRAKNQEPPLVLGPLAGMVGFLGREFVLGEARNNGRPEANQGLRLFDKGAYFSLIDSFESLVPLYNEKGMTPSMTVAEEKSAVNKWLECPKDDQRLRNAEEFIGYIDGVVRPRARRLTRFAENVSNVEVVWPASKDDVGITQASKDAVPSSQERTGDKKEKLSNTSPGAISEASSPLSAMGDQRADPLLMSAAKRREAIAAALALLQGVNQSTIQSGEAGPQVKAALMALAVRGWTGGPYPYMTPAKLRDCWLQAWIDGVEVKAIVLLFALEEGAVSVNAVSRSTWSRPEASVAS